MWIQGELIKITYRQIEYPDNIGNFLNRKTVPQKMP